jgi:hypothetical protein
VARSTRLALGLLAIAVMAVAGACGGGATDDGDLLRGRVVVREAERYCVTDDRGATRTCVDSTDPGDVEGVDVGECVETSRDLTRDDRRVRVLPDAACVEADAG